MRAAGRRSGAAWTRALLRALLLLVGPASCLRRQDLFPYGPENGDLELESGDDRVSPALELSTALRFFDKSDILSVYVSAPRAGRRGPRGTGGLSSVARPEAGGRGARQAEGKWASGAGTDPLASGLRARAGAPSPVQLRLRLAPDVPPARCLSPRGSRSWGARCVCTALRAPCPSGTPRSRDPERGVLPRAVRGIKAGKSTSLLSRAFRDRTRPGGTRRARGTFAGP